MLSDTLLAWFIIELPPLKIVNFVHETLQAFPGFGEQGNEGIYFRGTRQLCLKLRAKKAIWGRGNTENQAFDFGEQGINAIYFRETGKQVPSPPHPWEGLKTLSILI